MRSSPFAVFATVLFAAVLIAAVLFEPGAALATDRITVGTAAGNAGATSITVDVSMTNDRAVHAFSLSMAYDPSVLTLKGITDQGTATADAPAEFFQPTIDNVNGFAILGVILSYGDPYSNLQFAPSPSTARRVAVLTFDIASGASPGDYPIELVDGIGSPAASNVFSSAGTTIRPNLLDGTVTVINQNVFKLDTTSALPGSQITVQAYAKHPATLQGYSIAFLFDKSILTYVSATCLGTDAALSVRPNTIEVFQPKIKLDFSSTLARLTAGAVTDFVPPFTAHEIPASPNTFQSLAKFTFNITNDPALLGTGTDLVFHDGGPTDGNNTLIINEASIIPAFQDGRINFISSPTFRRGYINADTRIDISDGITMLGYLFLGGTWPECMNAADVNDDNRADLSDAISLFNYLFNGGAAPRAPFEACGADPTPGNLGCTRSVQCQ
jgi:hypothetical protein